MIEAAFLSFAAILIAWIVAPEGSKAPRVSTAPTITPAAVPAQA